jgi:glucose-6-phosphate dehydrogenase assembly protein OpcA
MATTVGDRSWRQSTPDAVDRDLATLWRDIGHTSPVARAVMSNLVVFRLHERQSADRVDPTPTAGGNDPGRVSDALLRDVVARHPSRTIVIEHDLGNPLPGRPIAARVGVDIFGPSTARYGVEWIVIRSACAEASLPSILRRFVLGDVPTSIWWTEDLSSAHGLEPIVATARQLVYDSRQWRDVGAAIRTLAPYARGGRLDLADLNWRRLSPLRLGLARGGFRLGKAASARIDCHRGERALASLLGGWLAASLLVDRDTQLTIVEQDLRDDRLQLELGEGDRRLLIRLNDQRVAFSQSPALPLVLATPHQADAEHIAVELRSLSTDRALADTLQALGNQLAS